MKSKILLSVFVVLAFMSCSNGSEVAYNEQAAALYYSASDDFEFCYEKFKDGGFKTKYEKGEFDLEGFGVESLKNKLTGCQNSLHLLKPSEKAQAFHSKLDEYFQLIGVDFANALQAYTDLDCDCPEKKDSLRRNVNNLYKRISELEEQCLEVQKAYIESVGGKGKAR
ncbi:hypothetical protein [Viscerimonas tarda]